MLQARFVTDAEQAKALARRLEAAFDEEGYPVSCYDTAYEGPFAVEVLFPDLDADAAEQAMRAALGATFNELDPTIAPLPEENWVARSLEGLSPVIAGRFFLHGSHDRDRRRVSGTNIEIDANLAFGTGHHGSTHGCLIALDHVLKHHDPRHILDLGTGTGVLALACALTLKRKVLATDIDPVAVTTTQINARFNGVAPLVEAVTAPGFSHPAFRGRPGFDLVLANILARPLAALAREMARHLAPGSVVILSGLRREDGSRILAAYGPHGLRLVRRIIEADWLTLVLAR